MDTNKKSVKSANIDEGFFKPEPENKVDYLTVKEKSQLSKKDGPGTTTNDSLINQMQNLDISHESKKFLMSSRYGKNAEEEVNME